MNSLDRRKIRENYVELVRNLNPEDVMDYLYQERALSEDDCENIRSAATRAQRMRLFLAILPKRDPGALSKLLIAMANAGYLDLVEMLKDQSTDDDSSNISISIKDITPVHEDNPFLEDVRLLELKEKLEHQSEVVFSMKQEMAQLQAELKRQSQNYPGNEKYQQTVEVLNELEKEEATREQLYDEVYQIVLKDINKKEEDTKEKEKDKESGSSRTSTLSKHSLVQRHSTFRTPSFTVGTVRHFAKIKCVLLGDGETGKTSIINYFIHKKQMQSYVPTVFDNRRVYVTNGSTQVVVDFWDTAGQEDYDRLRPLSYADSHIALMVFSVTKQKTLHNILDKWYREFRHYCPKTPVILVGNKTDPVSENKALTLRKEGHRFVTAQEAHKAAQVIKSARKEAFLCSARNGDGIDKLLEALVEVGYGKMLKERKKKGVCVCM